METGWELRGWRVGGFRTDASYDNSSAFLFRPLKPHPSQDGTGREKEMNRQEAIKNKLAKRGRDILIIK